MSFQNPSCLNTYINPELFKEDFNDEEFMEIMSDCVELLEEGETSERPRIPHTVKRRDRESANEQLMADDFVEDAKYLLWYFRRRFRMTRPLFMRIVSDIMLYPYRHPSHVLEHFRRMQDKLVDGGQRLYKEDYFRRLTPEDIDPLYDKHGELHGFSGMLGSIDCMHWPWEIIEDHAPDSSFTVNGTHYRKGYYLADGIYPEWSVFVKSYSCPQDDKKKKFKQYQESVRKDVERAFGSLQNQWHILT
uniref:uncharacterized protein LOC122610488 n=1 Tax=Erigeron canadensis TaxID=72917 RepID=UPI001CB9CA32|nr:uncharacterized protein LOC122610488 [Erigeron canadensis]